MQRKALSLITLLVLLAIASSSLALAAQEAPDAWRAKVDPWVLDTASEGETEFIVFLTEQANVSGAEALTSKVEKGRFVFEALTQTADATQGPVLKALQTAGVEYRPYWITNMIWVRGGLGAVEAMARRSDVAHVYANPTVHVDEPVSKGDSAAPASPSAIEWNITKVNAPSVWAAGYTGQGAVVAGQDTGYQWDHPGIEGQIPRLGRQHGQPRLQLARLDPQRRRHVWRQLARPVRRPRPRHPHDGHDGRRRRRRPTRSAWRPAQSGSAAATWTRATARRRRTASATSSSWRRPPWPAPTRIPPRRRTSSTTPGVAQPSEGCTDPNVMLTLVNNVRAAGIVTVHSAGNSGSACSTVSDPSAIYDSSTTVGATTSTDAIASYSSRGPVTVDGSNRLKPDISAPGSNIRSSVSRRRLPRRLEWHQHGRPHVAGLVALLISARPDLAGNVDAIENIIEQSAVHLTSATQTCGGVPGTQIPNNTFGYGRINALAMYQALCPYNVNGLNGVNIVDVQLVAGAFGTNVPAYDFNHDNIVDVADLIAVAQQWIVGC